MPATAGARIVTSELQGPVKWIRFNRPEVKNAITPESALLLRDELERAVGEGARVVVLAGVGGAFCSGADLKAVAAQMGEKINVRDALRDGYHRAVLAMTRSPLPVIAAVDGAAAGIGCDIALAADMRLLSENAFFSEIFVHINLIPDGGGTFTLPRLVGSGRALEMALTGCRVPAQQALAWGLANRVYPVEGFEAHVQKFAAELAQRAPLAVARSKEAIRAALGAGTLEDSLAREANIQQELIETSDFREGVTAFLTKRQPNFQGK